MATTTGHDKTTGGAKNPGGGGGVLARILLAAILTLMAMMGSTAWAGPSIIGSADGGGGGATNMCGTTGVGAAINKLPVNRWGESSTSFHYRLDADAWNDLAEKVQRLGRDSAFMQIGNAAWRLGADALFASSTFCPIQTLGRPLDNMIGVVGDALGSAGLLAALAVTTIGVALMGLRKGQGGAHVLKQTLKTSAIMGLLTMMILGGAASTDAGPGTGSPWWWVSQVNTVVNTVSGTVASAAVDSSGPSGYQRLWAEEGTTAEWPISCTTIGDTDGYVAYLHKTYRDSIQFGAIKEQAAALPEMVSTLWESGVLPVWAAAQFGASNPYTDHVYCFFLDAKANATVSSNAEILAYLGERLGMDANMQSTWTNATKSQNTRGDNGEDQALLGWAACIPSGGGGAAPRGDWGSAIDKTVTDDDCEHWWTGGDTLDGSSLDWDENSVASNAAGSAAVYNYAASVHGKDGTAVGSIMFAYLAGSLIDGAILLMLAMLQLASKLIVAFMVVGLFAAVARSLAPGDDGRLFKRTGLQLVGAVFVSSCAGLLIAVIMMVASAVSTVGSTTFSPGTTGAILATCLGPAAGVLLLHWLFTAVLHVPSPFTFKGAMAWGQGITSGTVGGAALGGLTGLASNAGRAVRGAFNRSGAQPPRPGDGRRQPDDIDPDRAKASMGKNRHVFTHRSAAEQLNDRPGVMDRARAEQAERRAEVEKEARRLASGDGRLGEPDAWKDYKGKARANLRRAKAAQIKKRFAGAVQNAAGRAASGVRALSPRNLKAAAGSAGRRAAAATATRAVRAASAASALGGWVARHPVRAAAAAGAAGWRTAAAGARAAAAGAGALRRMPAKKAVAAAAGAAMAVGAAPVAAGIVAAGAGAGWARRRGDRIRAEQADRARAEQARRAEQERADLAARTAQAVLDAQAGQTDQGGSAVPGDPVTPGGPDDPTSPGTGPGPDAGDGTDAAPGPDPDDGAATSPDTGAGDDPVGGADAAPAPEPPGAGRRRMDRVGDLVDVVRNRDSAPADTRPRPDGAPGPADGDSDRPGPGDGDDLALEVLDRARTRAGKPAS
ncbi:MAG: hypothetical protein D8B55_03150 [Actinomyces sp.]|nr:MAG: hypothetical protein D8B55_03150 [Actinomyces sp.]